MLRILLMTVWLTSSVLVSAAVNDTAVSLSLVLIAALIGEIAERDLRRQFGPDFCPRRALG